MLKLEERVIGCLLGVAIGDALGKPIESMTPKDIAEKFGRVTDYQDCKDHKYFGNDLKGDTTDDWQLTKATALGLINGRGLDLDQIAFEHVEQYKVTTAGWGKSTKEAVERLANGVSYKESGKTEEANRGFGNGVIMKIAPITIYSLFAKKFDISNEIVDYTNMTHCSNLAIDASMTHNFALHKLFEGKFKKDVFYDVIVHASEYCEKMYGNNDEIKLNDRIRKLNKEYSVAEIIESNDFGTGSCYVYDSLPFTYAFFLRNPHSIESLYECVNAGGDTDTNASILGGMLGALNGYQIFPQHLINGLNCLEEVKDICARLLNKLKNNLDN